MVQGHGLNKKYTLQCYFEIMHLAKCFNVNVLDIAILAKVKFVVLNRWDCVPQQILRRKKQPREKERERAQKEGKALWLAPEGKVTQEHPRQFSWPAFSACFFLFTRSGISFTLHHSSFLFWPCPGKTGFLIPLPSLPSSLLLFFSSRPLGLNLSEENEMWPLMVLFIRLRCFHCFTTWFSQVIMQIG